MLRRIGVDLLRTTCKRTMSASSSCSKPQSPSQEQIDRVRGRVNEVKGRMDGACKHVKRIDRPRLVAISKLHPPSSIYAAHKYADQHHFGENYAQELIAKAPVLPSTIQWHFVGKLQSNKAKGVAAIPNLFLVETVDSVKLANALDKARSAVKGYEAAGDAPPLNVYIQINTSGEENKGGLGPLSAEIEKDGDADVVQLAKHIVMQCNSLRLRGLMTIGSATNSSNAGDRTEVAEHTDQPSAEARKLNPDFGTLFRTRHALVRALREGSSAISEAESKERYGDLLNGEDETGGLELSMGMSADLEVAIAAGSNNVRVGTDCFGLRPGSRDEAMKAMEDELQNADGGGQ